MDKLVISVAPTGSLTLPTQTPYLPITPEQIAEEARKSVEAGASIVHVHARDPETGAPTSDHSVFRNIATRIKAKCNAIINLTTGGGLGMTAAERVAVVPAFKPEMASLDMGSMNFSIHPLLGRYSEWKHPWEPKLVQMTHDFVFKNTFADLEHFIKTMNEHATKPELEAYDVSHLYNAEYLLKQGLLKLPAHIQFVMGVLGGIGKSVEDLVYLKRVADRIFGKDYTWSVLGIGYPAEFHLGAVAIATGGHVRVGFEDNIFVTRGVQAKSNAELVSKIVRISKEMGREIATPEDARKMLGLKGLDKVDF